MRIPLFRNESKTKDSQPDYRFSYNDGDEWVNVIAGWVQTSASGKEYISLNIENLAKYAEYREKETVSSKKAGREKVAQAVERSGEKAGKTPI